MIVLKKSHIKTLLGSIFLFLYIFPFKLYILPLNNLHFIFIISFAYLVIKSLYSNTLLIDKRVIGFFLLIVILGLWSLVSCFNGSDFIVIKLLLVFSGGFIIISYFLIDLFFRDLKIEDIFKIIVYVLLAQAVIAFVIFLNPSIKNIYFNIIDLQDDLELVKSLSSIRLIGLGVFFFGMGTILSYGLIIISWLIINTKMIGKQTYFFVFAYIIIMAASLFSARTSTFGIILSMAYLLCSIRGLSFLVKVFICLLIGIVIGYFLIPEDVSYSLQSKVFPWAFEALYNYFDNSTLETASSNRLQEMYFEFNNYTTFMIGDGYMNDPIGNGYYMNTDAGYMRQIFSYGIIGLVMSLVVYSYVLVTFLKDKSLTMYVLITIIFELILNIKGLMFFYSHVDKILILIFLFILLKRNNFYPQKFVTRKDLTTRYLMPKVEINQK